MMGVRRRLRHRVPRSNVILSTVTRVRGGRRHAGGLHAGAQQLPAHDRPRRLPARARPDVTPPWSTRTSTARPQRHRAGSFFILLVVRQRAPQRHQPRPVGAEQTASVPWQAGRPPSAPPRGRDRAGLAGDLDARTVRRIRCLGSRAQRATRSYVLNSANRDEKCSGPVHVRRGRDPTPHRFGAGRTSASARTSPPGDTVMIRRLSSAMPDIRGWASRTALSPFINGSDLDCTSGGR